ncbi:MAG: mRNA surveillance protein pelota [Candidatus Thermoplasmatota archaeon]
MKIVFRDHKTGEMKIIAENLDDLWHLYHIIEEGDLVRGVTFRTDEQPGDKLRSKKPEKKRMKLGIRVEKVQFHEFSDRLRIQGVIEEGPQDIGSYHTFNIDAESMEAFSIVKDQWKEHQLERINEAVKQRMQPVLVFVSLDEDTATVAILRQSGVQWIADVDSKRSGKMYESKETSYEYFGDIVGILKTYVTKETPLVVIGPGFTREHFIAFGKSKYAELFSNVQTHAASHPGMNGIHEALKLGVVEQITKDNRVSLETRLVEKLFEEIKKDGCVAYGAAEVEDALHRGAVERLLISDVFVRSKKGEQLLELARQTRSDFTIINSLHEAGRKFEHLGGVAALLRFKI